MKRILFRIAIAIVLICALCPGVLAQELLIPGGQVIGLELNDDTVTVAALDDRAGGCARKAGLEPGDQLVSINGSPITCPQDVHKVLERNPTQVNITVSRNGKQKRLTARPEQTPEGPRLGVYLRQGITGIGTVTYYRPDTGEFGALGHGVSDGRGELMRMKQGSAFPAQVADVKQGKVGAPGQLRGNADACQSAGSLQKNTPQGVFGKAARKPVGQPLPVAAYDEIETGAATIRSTVSGSSVQEYSVEISKIYPENRADGRNFVLKVTDPRLLTTTGGIVQGMGVSYNRDNPEKPLACRVIWGWSQFCLTLQITAYHAQVCWETIIRCP